MAASVTFDYDRAFSRDIGWVAESEQAKLKKNAELRLPGWAALVVRTR